MNTLTDIMLYFAKFPLKAGTLKMFNKTSSETFSGYAALLAQFSQITPHSLITGLNDYVFGLDEASISRCISNVDGSYLFIDYGHITSDRDNYDRQNDKILLALTVATPLKQDSMDAVEQMMMAQRNLDMLLEIRDIMKADSRCNPFVQQLTFPHEITPFFSRELSDSSGWTMVFQKAGIGLV